MRTLLWIGILLCGTGAAGAQEGGSCERPVSSMSAAAFTECARTGTERYRDRTVAIADGYRRVGRDFPAMGEHWIRVSLLFDGKFDPSRPEILNYVVIGGRPELVGVGYAVPLLAGEQVPDAPAGAHAWHQHSRTIDAETVLPHHHTTGHADGGARLAMLHAWVWSPNPDGMFAADNWAIPFLRLGRTLPSDPPREAAKAISLANGGRDYFETAIEAAGASGIDERRTVKAAIDRAQADVRLLLEAAPSGGLSETIVGRLAKIWIEMWRSIDADLPARVQQKLAELPIR